MSWRDVLGIRNPKAIEQNSHNPQNSKPAENSADIANIALKGSDTNQPKQYQAECKKCGPIWHWHAGLVDECPGCQWDWVKNFGAKCKLCKHFTPRPSTPRTGDCNINARASPDGLRAEDHRHNCKGFTWR